MTVRRRAAGGALQNGVITEGEKAKDPEFAIRESPLTVLIEHSLHIRAIYHIFVVILLLLLCDTVVYDLVERGKINIGVTTVVKGFRDIGRSITLWLFELAVAVSFYPGLHLYAAGRKLMKKNPASTMRAVLVLAFLACAVALVYGDFVCGRSYCKDHPCDKPIASSSCRSPSQYRANHADKCACCPACVTLLSEGQACKTYSKELGETPSAVCREPLKCLKGVCTNVPPRK